MSRFYSVLRPLLGNLRNEVGSAQQTLTTPKTHPGYKKALQLSKSHAKKVWNPTLVRRVRFKGSQRDISSHRFIKSPTVYTRTTSVWLMLEPTLNKTLPDSTKRLHVSRQQSKGGIMRSYVQIITTPTADTPGTTLLLHFDNKRYIIGNVSEG